MPKPNVYTFTLAANQGTIVGGALPFKFDIFGRYDLGDELRISMIPTGSAKYTYASGGVESPQIPLFAFYSTIISGIEYIFFYDTSGAVNPIIVVVSPFKSGKSDFGKSHSYPKTD